MRLVLIVAIMLALSMDAFAGPKVDVALALAKAKHQHKQLRGCYCGGSCGAFCQCPDQGDCLGRWTKAEDGLMYWRKNGKVTHAYNPVTKEYWKVQNGQWVRWVEETKAPQQGVCRT